jgi:hypothetical protein
VSDTGTDGCAYRCANASAISGSDGGADSGTYGGANSHTHSEAYAQANATANANANSSADVRTGSLHCVAVGCFLGLHPAVRPRLAVQDTHDFRRALQRRVFIK